MYDNIKCDSTIGEASQSVLYPPENKTPLHVTGTGEGLNFEYYV